MAAGRQQLMVNRLQLAAAAAAAPLAALLLAALVSGGWRQLCGCVHLLAAVLYSMCSSKDS